jgi:hypothetical protein
MPTARRSSNRLLLALFVGLLASLADPATHASGQEGGVRERLKDPQDGRLDLSAWLAEAHGFLPVVSLITEPAVDYGVAGAAAFFHRPPGWTLEGAREAFNRGEMLQTPSVSVAAGGYTFNDSWFVGGGHLGVWRGDRIRYTGFGGYGSFNLSLAGVTPSEKDFSFDYNLEGWGLVQSLRWRLPDSRWFVGGTWTLVGLTTRFDADRLPTIGPVQRESRNGSLGAVLAYDSRDNIFTPNRGVSGTLEGKRHDDLFLGDYEYWQGDLDATSHHPVASSLVLAFRVRGSAVSDGAPFWGLPGVLMRGVPAQLYLGERMAQGEAEVRWDLDSRWSLVGFGGMGWTRNTLRDQSLSRTVGAGGVGFRYLLARAFGVRGGLDVAYGSDGLAFYVTMGSAWR